MQSVLTTLLLLSIFSIHSSKINKAPNLPKDFKNDYALIPSGNVAIDEKTSVEVNSFYISKYEVSNKQYREFLKETAKSSDINAVLVNDPFPPHYFTDPQFDNFPVLNISKEEAIAYCQWLTEKIRKQTGNENFTFRLPKRAEWIKAARGDKRFGVYAWSGPYLRNAKGGQLCNYKSYGSENIHYDAQTATYKIMNSGAWEMNPKDESQHITASVNAYFPSDMGLYNMNGNVAEMLEETGWAAGGSWNSTGYDVRNVSILTYKQKSLEVGFRPILVFQKDDVEKIVH